MSEKSYEFGNWTLKEILTDKRLEGALFRIPDYQRGYAWGRRQREEFWEDLLTLQRNDKSENAAESDSGKKGNSHYMGAITVECKKDEGGYPVYEVVDGQQHPVYEVVDGQQRLTTIAILLSVLGGHEFCSRFSYGESNENHDFFQNILKPSFSDKPSNVYQKNLVDAKSFFAEKVDNLDGDNSSSDAPSDEDIKAWLVGDSEERRLEFDFRILRQDHNAGIIFETMNNRGKPLTLLEKLKNRLMYLTEIAAVEDESDDDEIPIDANELRRIINNTWGNIYGALTYKLDRASCDGDEFISLDEDEFVAAHLSVYRNPEDNVYSEAGAESRLFKMFCADPTVHPKSESVDEADEKAMEKVKNDGWEAPLSLKKINQYVEDLRAFAPAWAAIHKQFENACGHCRLLSGTREVKTFLASVWLALPKNEQGEPNGEDEIFAGTENLLFRNTVSGKNDNATFSTLARRLHGKCLDQLKGDDKNAIGIDKVRGELENYLADEKRTIDAKTLVKAFSDRMDRQQSPYGVYGWPGLKYFLFTQETEETGEKPLSWDRFDDVSIEHIIPQSATDDHYDGWWKRQIEEFAGQQPTSNDEALKRWRKRKRTLVNSLGNFVLLTRGENSSVSDDPWEHYDEVPGTHREVIGKQKFYSAPDKVSSAGARAVAENVKGWRAYHVRERGRELFKTLASQLGVIFQDKNYEDQIDKALGFEPHEELDDTPFKQLGEAVVSNLAPPRLGTAVVSGESNVLLHDFLEQFYKWCQDNNAQFACRPTNANYVGFARHCQNDYSLRFHRAGASVDVSIYAEQNVNNDNVESQRKNVETMNRLWQFHTDIETKLKNNSDTIDCHWELQQPSPGEVRHRKAEFRRCCNIENPEETFRLMVADAKTLVEVLNEHGEDIQ